MLPALAQYALARSTRVRRCSSNLGSQLRPILTRAPTPHRTAFISDSVPLAEGILGTVEELHLSVGEAVQEYDVIAVIETDKVSLDVKAMYSGVVAAVCVSPGQEVKEQQPLYELEAA